MAKTYLKMEKVPASLRLLAARDAVNRMERGKGDAYECAATVGDGKLEIHVSFHDGDNVLPAEPQDVVARSPIAYVLAALRIRWTSSDMATATATYSPEAFDSEDVQ